jgi:hypothetical protein
MLPNTVLEFGATLGVMAWLDRQPRCLFSSRAQGYRRLLSTLAYDKNYYGHIFLSTVHYDFHYLARKLVETPFIDGDGYCKHIVRNKRHIADIILMWSGSSAELCHFSERFGNVNDNVKLKRQGTPSAEDMVVVPVYSPASADFDRDLNLYHKVGVNLARSKRICPTDTSRASLVARHVFRVWIKAEMQRLLTHSSIYTVWFEGCGVFYNHLRNRGYPTRTIDPTIRVEPAQHYAEPRSTGQTTSYLFSTAPASS